MVEVARASATSAVVVALAVVASGTCAVMSWRHARRIARITGGDVAALAQVLRRLPEGDRLAELARRTTPSSWEHGFALVMASQSTARTRIAAANEELSEVARQVEVGSAWPRAAVRIAASSAVLFATIGFLMRAGPVALGLVLAIGMVGALASASAGQRARAEASRQRAAIDALVAAALGPAATDAPSSIGEQQEGHRRRRQGRL